VFPSTAIKRGEFPGFFRVSARVVLTEELTWVSRLARQAKFQFLVKVNCDPFIRPLLLFLFFGMKSRDVSGSLVLLVLNLATVDARISTCISVILNYRLYRLSSAFNCP
jgi:hypothetical protein